MQKRGLTIRPPISAPTTQTKPENLYDADQICRLPFSNRKGIGISPEASDRRGSAGRAGKRISNFPAWLREPARRPDKRSHRAAGVSERSSYLVIASALRMQLSPTTELKPLQSLRPPCGISFRWPPLSWFRIRAQLPSPAGRRLAAVRTGVSDCAGLATNETQPRLATQLDNASLTQLPWPC